MPTIDRKEAKFVVYRSSPRTYVLLDCILGSEFKQYGEDGWDFLEEWLEDETKRAKGRMPKVLAMYVLEERLLHDPGEFGEGDDSTASIRELTSREWKSMREGKGALAGWRRNRT